MACTAVSNPAAAQQCCSQPCWCSCPFPPPVLPADPTAMLLALVPPLYMHVMHPLLDSFAASRQAVAAGGAGKGSAEVASAGADGGSAEAAAA